MSVFVFSSVLFVLLTGVLVLRDLLYAHQVARNGKATERLP